VPMIWWPDDKVVSAVIEGQGPWPSHSPVSIGTFVPFDVDKYDGLAVVIGYGRNRKGREVLGSDEFQQNDAGAWEHLSGGGTGWSRKQRWDLQEGREALHLRMEGSSGSSPFDTRREFSFAVFLCGPAVTTVEVDRRHGIRIADVNAGPGWLTDLFDSWRPSRGDGLRRGRTPVLLLDFSDRGCLRASPPVVRIPLRQSGRAHLRSAQIEPSFSSLCMKRIGRTSGRTGDLLSAS
jgi:hypothetical protein